MFMLAAPTSSAWKARTITSSHRVARCLRSLFACSKLPINDENSRDRVSVALPLSSINRYVAKACETSRCLTEAEEVYYAGHVFECAVETAENARFDFLAFVLQTTAINSAPHEVKITVCDAVVDRASCSCKAGQKSKRPQLEGNILERLLENVSYQYAAKMHSDRGNELATEATLEPTIEPGCSTSEPAPRDLTLIGCLKELRNFLGISGEVTTEELLEQLQESKSHEDIIMIEN
ncbi:uncharacterized protein LOC142579986 [Dermacentor variabilis]|uniref:uncharacterized protein LOC142579986 n=1 Tax=Dermacentor variabilis TaxID=34621 RepID=UPI003F5B47FA